jgi:hypothetical protein
MRSSRTRRAAAASVALLTILALAEPATAAIPGATGAVVSRGASAVPGLESSLEDRVRAAGVVGVVAPDDWLVLSERDFVFKLWQNAQDLSEVRGSAELALINCTSTEFVECTVYIESGIHAAKARDVASQVRDATVARQAREIKQQALVVLEIPVTPELLLLPDRDFVYAIYQRATGERVRAAALAAFGGTAPQQRDFITTGVVQAREQDRNAEIEADRERTEAEREALRNRDARKWAAALLGVVAAENLLVISDENFVRWVWNTAAKSTEVYVAAETALRSADPVAWKTFIFTGIHEADHRDQQEELRQQALEYRRLISGIEATAEREGRTKLAKAARDALAGSDNDVFHFWRVGRHQVSDNECANPALATDVTGWGGSSSLVKTRQAITDHAEAQWEYAVATGAATTERIYLPHQKVLPGAQWELGAQVRTLNDQARARMEIDWYGPGDAYLGHTNGGYLPVDGTRAFTRVSGRFPVPAGAERAQVLVRAGDLAANSGFSTTMCAYKPILAPDATVTGVPGNGTGSITWKTNRTDIVSWNVGRDGTDTRGNGPWSTTVATGVRSHQFNLLRNDTTYAFTLIPNTAAGPLPAITVGVTPSTNPPPAPEGTTGDGVQAATALGWGAPLAQYSDEFAYSGRPDPAKWSDADECWDNPHASGGQRCASATTVDDGKLVMTGAANGTTGWLQNDWKTRYGRWEARVRSRNTTSSNGRTYHPLLIVWPDGDKWPDEGEYDFLENQAPGAACAEAFLHYPHPKDGDNIYQEHAKERNCGTPLSQWHNIAFEWTPDHVRGFVDGVEWFRYSGGANSKRRAMQTMASGHLTIQLDNFAGTNMTPATYEAEWVRVYPV